RPGKCDLLAGGGYAEREVAVRLEAVVRVNGGLRPARAEDPLPREGHDGRRDQICVRQPHGLHNLSVQAKQLQRDTLGRSKWPLEQEPSRAVGGRRAKDAPFETDSDDM